MADPVLFTSQLIPVGGMILWPATTDPGPNWAFALGQEYDRIEYSGLYAAYGLAHGSPSSGSVFKVPNMDDRVPIGAGNQQAGSTGDPVGTVTAAGKGSLAGSATIGQANLPNVTFPDTIAATVGTLAISPNPHTHPPANQNFAGTQFIGQTGAGSAFAAVNEQQAATGSRSLSITGAPAITGSVTSGGSGTSLSVTVTGVPALPSVAVSFIIRIR